MDNLPIHAISEACPISEYIFIQRQGRDLY